MQWNVVWHDIGEHLRRQYGRANPSEKKLNIADTLDVTAHSPLVLALHRQATTHLQTHRDLTFAQISRYTGPLPTPPVTY